MWIAADMAFNRKPWPTDVKPVEDSGWRALAVRLEEAGSGATQWRAVEASGDARRSLHLDEERMCLLAAEWVTALAFLRISPRTGVGGDRILYIDIDPERIVAPHIRERRAGWYVQNRQTRARRAAVLIH